MLRVYFIMCFLCVVTFAATNENSEVLDSKKAIDLDTSATSASLFTFGGLFGQYPNYGYGSNYPNTYRPNSNRPNNYYPPSSSGGYYPPSNSGGYYPPTNSGGYYPTTNSVGYSPSISWTDSQQTNGGFIPNSGYNPLSSGYPQRPGTGGTYYPNTGTNILGSTGDFAGYGGYGGNGGLNQYTGYWNPNYTGQRNLGYGYFAGTNRYGLPQRGRDIAAAGNRDLDRDHIPGGYRGYD